MALVKPEVMTNVRNLSKEMKISAARDPVYMYFLEFYCACLQPILRL